MNAAATASLGWEPQRAASLRAARRRSRLIAGLRRLFVSAAGASFASVFVFMALYAVEGGFNQNQYAAAEPLRMINPRFIGRTESGGPYQITAEMAERPRGDGPIELAAPVYRTDAGTIMLAPRGIYDEAAQSLGVRRRGPVLGPGRQPVHDPGHAGRSGPGHFGRPRAASPAPGPLACSRRTRMNCGRVTARWCFGAGVRGQIPDNEGLPAASGGGQ